MVESIVLQHFAAVSGPIEWGVDDCCALIGDICMELYGIDLMEPVGPYSTQIGAIARLREYSGGGVLEAAQKRMNELGFDRAYPPYKSDAIGVVAGEEGPLLAMFHKDRWLARSHDGADSLPAWSAVIAWELPICPR